MKKNLKNLKKNSQLPMTFKEYLLQRELSHQDTFSKRKNTKLYKNYLKKYEW